MKAAYTGIAVSNIGGKTCHVMAPISLNGPKTPSNNSKDELCRLWCGKRYLIIDEFSMLSKSFLARLSRNIAIGMDTTNTAFANQSFGGLNVILCGDLHQFPPVAVKWNGALYRPLYPSNDDFDNQIGRGIYEEFTMVVILQQQNRVTNPEWISFLTHLRLGQATSADVRLLKSLVMTPDGMKDLDMSRPPWNETCLVTPWHSVRRHWNDATLHQWCSKSGNQVLICTAEDALTTRRGSKPAQILPDDTNSTDREQQRIALPATIQIAVGMKVMVTENLETDLDITNGARGTITDIVLHPKEPPLPDTPIVRLMHLPSYILIKLNRTKASPLPGLETSMVPLLTKADRYGIHGG